MRVVPLLSFPDEESRGLPFYKSHGKSVPVAVMPSVIRKRYYAPGEEERKRKKEERKTRRGRRARAHARKVFIESLSRLSPREPFWAGRVYQSGDNRTQFPASLLWSGFTPSSSPFLPPSSPLPPISRPRRTRPQTSSSRGSRGKRLT